MEDRTANIHAARVYLREARARRASQRGFSFTLLDWAANARRRAAASRRPAQHSLFGDAP